jgi:excisionase family DNA binding protein
MPNICADKFGGLAGLTELGGGFQVSEINKTALNIPRSSPRLPKGPGLEELNRRSSPFSAVAGGKIELLRVSRVARMLDVSTKRVYQMIAEGKLRAMRLGPRQLRIPKGDLEIFLRKAQEDVFK